MAVEDRLGDPGLARDLGGRRAAVALLEEDAAGRVEHAPAGAPRGSRRRRRASRAHAQPRRTPRAPAPARLGVARLAHRRRRRSPRRRARSAPRPRARRGSRAVNATGCGLAGAEPLATPEATIAPMIAIPSEPPTCRMLFSTAEPTPALSRAHRGHRGRGGRRHRQRHADAADQHRRQEAAEVSRARPCREKRKSEHREQDHPAADEPARARPGRRSARRAARSG